ncbi:MAG: branched-chain amino acid transport system permease protein livM [Actinomycetota bacterium]
MGVTQLIDDNRVRTGCTYVAAALAFYFIQQWFWPAPIGVLVQGLVIGGLTALVAFGIALVYRANRVINFAQGDLGGVPASVAVLLIVSRHWPYPLAVGAGLAASLVLGAVIEYVVIRRFFKSPRLILTVVTIGLVTFFSFVEIALPRAFGVDSPPQHFASPFNFSFTINPIVFRGNDILAMVTVPVVIVALGAFFKYTHIGIAVRASAERADRAALLGVPVKRINTVVWVIATLLASVALFLRAGVVGLPIGSALGLPILLRALAAAVIGKFEKLGTIFVASAAIGIIEQAVVWHTRTGLLVDPILFGVIIAALLFQRRDGASRVVDSSMSSWQAVREIRPVPRELSHLPEVRWGLRGLTVALGVVALLAPRLIGEGRTVLAGALLLYGIVAISLVLLTGWAGQVSLGQFAFAGVGAAVGAWMTLHLHWDLSIILVASGIVGALVAVLIGIPALRIRGLFLAVATLGFALACSSYFLNGDYYSWIPNGGVRIPRQPLFGQISLDTEARFYYLCLACFLLAAWMVRGLRRSRTGRVLIGVRENERGVQSYGVNVTRAKLTAFAMSGFLAAAAGCLFVHQQQNYLRTSFTPQQSIAVFVMVVIGGLGSVPGAFLGAFFIKSLTWFDFLYPPGIRLALPLLGQGVGLIIILMFLPGGLGSLAYRVRDRLLRYVAKRRDILVPSLVADARDSTETTVGDDVVDVDLNEVVEHASHVEPEREEVSA